MLMDELLRLRTWIVVAMEDIIDEASSDADHEQLTRTLSLQLCWSD